MSLPSIPAGTWTIDTTHSEVGFSVRHLMVSKVKGRFASFEGAVTIAEDPLASSVQVSVDLDSVTTNEPQRDAHLRSADFFDAEHHPKMTFTSTQLRAAGDDFVLVGDLSLKGVTRPVELAVEYNGLSPDPWGGSRIGFSAETEISRKDFGVDIEMPLDGGGVVVGDKIKVMLEVEAILVTEPDSALVG
ncbi:MAG: YceI family protein [Acidimicrobiales bacterium]|nr:YceI family protein [Acidimicrobiales bacterium]